MIRGYLEFGVDPVRSEVVINLGHGLTTGRVTFSPAQARNLAHLLNTKADEIEQAPHPYHFGILVIGSGYPADMPRH